MMDGFDDEVAAAVPGLGEEHVSDGALQGSAAAWGTFEGEDEDFGFGASAGQSGGRNGVQGGGKRPGGGSGATAVLDLLRVEQTGKSCRQWLLIQRDLPYTTLLSCPFRRSASCLRRAASAIKTPSPCGRASLRWCAIFHTRSYCRRFGRKRWRSGRQWQPGAAGQAALIQG